jgi:adenosine/AMP kinase
MIQISSCHSYVILITSKFPVEVMVLYKDEHVHYILTTSDDRVWKYSKYLPLITRRP